MGSLTLEVDIERGVVLSACPIIPLPDVGCSVKVVTELRNKALWFFLVVNECYVHTFEAELRVAGTQADKITRFNNSVYKRVPIPAANIQTGLGYGSMYFDEAALRKVQAKHARPSLFFLVDVRNVKSDVTPARILLALAQHLPNQNILQAQYLMQRRLTEVEAELEAGHTHRAQLQTDLEQNALQLALRTSELEALGANPSSSAEPPAKRPCRQGVPSKTDIVAALPTLEVEALIELSSQVQKRLHEKLLESRASLTCPVCLEKPKTLKYRGCSHSVCVECATQAMVADKCVECRAENPTKGFDVLNL